MLQTLFRVSFLLVLAAALYAGLKAQPVPQVVSHFDLILHFGAFATLSVLWVLGFPRRWWLPGLTFLLFLGAGIELWQGWALPGRTASLVDMAANASGVAAGFVLALLFRVIDRVNFRHKN
ncbi:VanZ family protein [Microbulbifer yueqingensis]|uniref:VanZ like family protein n=1 Tax=Microbulbifer yueqingensis TaxID=658219 RepID=A0A1G8VL06_9GAMM|nr:VanZ family protein [Microbulbifer yueqingensis]SDJ66639.1 VanZ like family protein [Microbulbifer yueqingensis]